MVFLLLLLKHVMVFLRYVLLQVDKKGKGAARPEDTPEEARLRSAPDWGPERAGYRVGGSWGSQTASQAAPISLGRWTRLESLSV